MKKLSSHFLFSLLCSCRGNWNHSLQFLLFFTFSSPQQRSRLSGCSCSKHFTGLKLRTGRNYCTQQIDSEDLFHCQSPDREGLFGQVKGSTFQQNPPSSSLHAIFVLAVIDGWSCASELCCFQLRRRNRKSCCSLAIQ